VSETKKSMKPREHPLRKEIRIVARPKTRKLRDVADAVSDAVREAIMQQDDERFYVKAILISCDRIDPETQRPRGTRHPVTAVFWPMPPGEPAAQDGAQTGTSRFAQDGAQTGTSRFT
jgi:hypothetical protein